MVYFSGACLAGDCFSCGSTHREVCEDYLECLLSRLEYFNVSSG